MIKSYIIRAESDIDIDLSEYRRGKISRLKHSRDRALSTAAGAVLDLALSEYGLRERDMVYRLGSHGKPYFENAPQIFFNLSHTDGYAACCIGDRECGIDIQLSRTPDMRLAKRFFHEAEYEFLEKITDSRALSDAFFSIWVMKESTVKAVGTGIGGFKDFCVLPEQKRVYLNGVPYYLLRRTYGDAFVCVCSSEEEAAEPVFCGNY